MLFRGSLGPSVLDNFAKITNKDGKPYFEAMVIQVAFIVVLFCHVPFLFFAGKEGLCIVVDEVQRNSISKDLEVRLSSPPAARVHLSNKMVYKDMNGAVYIACTLGLYAVELVCAVFINNIDTVFDFASAIAVSFISFWFPSIYYLIAEKRYDKYNKYYHNMAWFLNILGIVNFALGVTTGIQSIVQ